jgi:hypothetical protein
MRSRFAIALVLLAAVTAGGCGGDSKSDKAMADVCAARDDITKQVDTLAGMTITTATTSQVGEALQAIKDDLSKIGDARKDLADDRREEVDKANDAFASSVRKTAADIGTSVSLQGAATQLKDAFQQLKSSYQSSFGEIDCS